MIFAALALQFYIFIFYGYFNVVKIAERRIVT